MNVWLLLSGDYAAPLVSINKDDVVIAVDGGMAHASLLGVTPSMWIGDFDSTSAALCQVYQYVPRQTFPTRKDDTDLGLALKYVQETYPNVQTVYMIGAFGDEFDHVFANFWILPHFQIAAVAWGVNNHAIYLPAKLSLTLTGDTAELVSVFALTALSDVTYQGLEWPLENTDIMPFSTFSARNALKDAQARIQWQHGDGLVVVSARIVPQVVVNR